MTPLGARRACEPALPLPGEEKASRRGRLQCRAAALVGRSISAGLRGGQSAPSTPPSGLFLSCPSGQSYGDYF